MKLLFTFCFILSLQVVASASDRSLEHQVNCDTAEARSLKGPYGSCRVLLTPKKVNQEGSCSGIFEGKFLCNISYVGDGSSASLLSLFCGSNGETVLEEEAIVESVEYKVTTIISGNGRTSLIEDPNTYTVFKDRTIEMSTVRTPSGRIKGQIEFNFGDNNIVALTNVVCE